MLPRSEVPAPRKPVVRLVIADDHVLFRQGLKSLLRSQPSVAVVGEVDRLDDLGPLLDNTECDVLLLDLGMERNALPEIQSLAARTRVIVVTATEHPAEPLAAMRAGARGVVFKRFAVETLMEAIRTVVAGAVWMPPDLQAHVAATLRDEPHDRLTPREVEVVRNVTLGMRNADIARKLHINEQTVKTHINNILRKVGARNRLELALYATQAGIVGARERLPQPR